MRIRTSILVTTALCALPPAASAVEFSPQGQASFVSGALFTYDFEGTVPPSFTAQTVEPLEGKQAGRLAAGGVAALPTIPLTGKHAVAISLFARGGATNGYLGVRYKPESKLPDVLVPLFPTGRVTSDGWYELRSSALSVDASTLESFFPFVQNLAVDPVDIDAIEVIEQGTYQEPIACTPPDSSVCGADRVCMSGICREAAAAVPALPSTQDERVKVSEIFSTQLDLFFGGIQTRKLYLSNALTEAGAMGAQKDAWSYWRQLLRAMHALHDGHTFGYVGYYPREMTAACFVEGNGDLSQPLAPTDPTYPDILVSHALPESTLQPGDRIVAVNGMHPIAFMRSLAGLYNGGYLGCDDASHSYAAQSLAMAIPAYASTVTVVSCPAGVCGALTTLPVAELKTTPAGASTAIIGWVFTSNRGTQTQARTSCQPS